MKKVLISILVICLTVTPQSIFAQQGGDGEQTAKVEYVQSEQMTLSNAPDIGCKAAYLANPETGKVIYEKNAHQKMYPASTTKILTALVTLENCKLDDKATVSKEAHDLIDEGYSNANLKTGEELSIYTLLQALLIPSANEAAIVLAEHISGSVGAFAELCNKRAKELGCKDLHFVNPNGLHDDMHYCTAYDLYLVAKECQKYDAFNEIVQTTEFTVPATDVYKQNDRKFENTNELILPKSKTYYPYCTGIKTGHTTPAGECLVSSSSNDGLNFICVVLGGSVRGEVNDRFADSVALYNFAYSNYSNQTVVEDEQVFDTLTVEGATDDTAELDLIADTEVITLLPNDFDVSSIEPDIKLGGTVEAPVKEGDVLGTATVKADGMNYTVNLVASHDVDKPKTTVVYIGVGAAAVVAVVVIATAVKRKKRPEE